MKTTHDKRCRLKAVANVPREINPLVRIPASVREKMRDQAASTRAMSKTVAALVAKSK